MEPWRRSVDAEAAAYGGTATVNGKPVIQLQHCVGPMMPVKDFDDPNALRQRFELLCGRGAEPGAFQGVPPLSIEPTNGQPGKRLSAAFQVPSSAPLFADHFPRRPVFPGSLLMHLNLELAAALALQIPAPAQATRWRLATISDIKLRTFISPGERLECEARLSESSNDCALVAVETRKANKLIGGARVRLAPENHP